MEKHHSKNHMRRETPFRGHLPPPFYIGKDEITRIGYPAEPALPHITSEDSSNYGVGGYYRNTSRAPQSHAIIQDQVGGSRDTYRHLGAGDNLSTLTIRGTKRDSTAKDTARWPSALKAVRVTEARDPAPTVVLMKGYSKI